MHPQLERAIRRLQRKLFRVAAIQGLCWGFGLIAVLGLIALGADRWVVVPRPQLPVLLVAMGLLVAAVTLYRVARSVRQPSMLAQWLDCENQLEYRLVSAFEFAGEPDVAADAWKRRCVEAGVELLQRQRLVLPRVPLGHLERPLGLVAVLVIVASVSALRHRVKSEADANLKVVLPTAQAGVDLERVRALTAEAQGADRQAQSLVHALDQLVEDVAQKRLRKQDALKQLAELEAAAASTGRGGAGETSGAPIVAGGASADDATAHDLPEGSAVQAAADAIKRGDVQQAAKALGEAAQALEQGTLSPAERSALAQLTAHLGQIRGASGGSGDGLGSAIEALTRGDDAAAARSLVRAAGQLGDLKPQLNQERVYRDLAKAMRQIERDLRGATADETGSEVADNHGGGEHNGPKLVAGAPAQTTGSTGGQSRYLGANGRGGFSGDSRRQQPSAQAASQKDLAIVGQWSGKTVRELVSGTSVGAAQPVLDSLLSAHQRVAEVAIDRDDIPDDYRVAVRNYFEAIRNAGEGAWKPTNR